MGFIRDLANKKFPAILDTPNSITRWNRSFRRDGASADSSPAFPSARGDGGSYARSNVSSPESVKRLLQALRSKSPGGWTDNRLEQERHFVGIQYITIHRTGEQLSMSKFRVKEKDPDDPLGDATRTANGEGADKLRRLLEKPNNEDGFGDYMYQINQQMDLTGLSLSWMVPNALGVPYELYPIPTAIAVPQPAVNPLYPDGYYRITPLFPYGPFSSYPTPSTAVGAPIPAQWMMRIKYPHPLVRYDGYAPATAMRLHLDEVEAMDRSRWYSMKRTISPSAVLNFEEMEGAQPLPEAEIERIRADFENNIQGPENAGHLFVATPGAKLEQWGLTPKEMEYYQSWEQLVSFCMAGFGITKPAAGMVDDSSYATLFATLKQLHLLTLLPKVARISRQLTRYLSPHFGDNLVIEIELPRIDDHDVRRADAETLIAGKAITKNELREKLGKHKTNEPWGEEIAGEGKEEQMMMQGMQPGQPQAVGQNGKPIQNEQGEDKPKSESEKESRMPEPPEVSRSRPDSGKLGEGSLGPKKSLNGKHKQVNYQKKTLSARLEKVYANGNGY